MQVRIYPDPCLRKTCQPVDTFDDSLRRLAERMITLMREHKGVGLAAPQVGVNLRLFVCNPTPEPENDRVYINPVLTDLVGVVEAEEGCLSIPEVLVSVRRAQRCRLAALDLTGQPVEVAADDLEARVWQHETDHLDGVLILDKMSQADKIATRRMLKQLEEDHRKNTRSRTR
jgi:peptide deformylase